MIPIRLPSLANVVTIVTPVQNTLQRSDILSDRWSLTFYRVSA